MTNFEKYVFILCLIVFTLLTLVFSSMLAMLTKQSVRLIRAGVEDRRICKEYIRSSRRGKKKTGWFSILITLFFAVAFFGAFAFTVYLQATEKKQTINVPTLRVVYSDSMSDKYEKNTYLFENNLNNQFDRFDVVITRALPKEEDLKLYDIVVYEVDDTLLIHRIVGIEEPNEKHPGERHFVLQGDLVERPDKFPVRYEQMRAIYCGEKIPYIGSFIMFWQSPAGYMCVILIVVEMFASPMMRKRLEREEKARLKRMLK